MEYRIRTIEAMKNHIKTVLACVFSLRLVLAASGGEEVLYWMVGDEAVVHHSGSASQMLTDIVPEIPDVTLAARVRVTGASIGDDVFLDMYIGDPGDPYAAGERWDGSMGIDFCDPGNGYWGVGVPTGMQSPLEGYMLGDYNDPAYSFIIEIGNYDWNADEWTTVAWSATQSYTSLTDKIYTTFDLFPPTTGIWSPTDFYTFDAVPEPSSGLLMLFGICMLMLRRRNTYHKRTT